VTPDADQLTDAQMQELARRFGQEAVFLLKPQSKAADLRVRYFVPDHELGVSGHATVAAVTIALARGIVRDGRAKVETISGLFEVSWARRSGGTVVTLEQNPPVFGATAAWEPVAQCLRIRREDIAFDSPIQSVSVSRAKLLVPMVDWRALDRIAPDYEALWKLCDELKVSGLYPFTRHTDKKNADLEARQFPLRAGFPEDAATGVAAGALGAYVAQHDLGARAGRHEFRIAQGYAMGAPSLIEAVAECDAGKVTRTAIRGTARIVRRERQEFAS
jgi:PhzF family phenazine biosynthesis protein